MTRGPAPRFDPAAWLVALAIIALVALLQTFLPS